MHNYLQDAIHIIYPWVRLYREVQKLIQLSQQLSLSINLQCSEEQFLQTQAGKALSLCTQNIHSTLYPLPAYRKYSSLQSFMWHQPNSEVPI